MERKELIKKFKKMSKGILNAKQVKMLADKGYFDVPSELDGYGYDYDIPSLAEHSMSVTEVLLDFTKKLGLKWERPESPYIVGLFHELYKVVRYVRDDDDWSYEEDVDGYSDGCRSVIEAREIIELTDEEEYCISEFLYDDADSWSYYFTQAMRCHENVLWTLTADAYTTHCLGK